MCYVLGVVGCLRDVAVEVDVFVFAGVFLVVCVAYADCVDVWSLSVMRCGCL